MVDSESGAQPSGARKVVQAGFLSTIRSGVLLSAGLALAGCSTISAMNPVNWWHRQEGGEIAKERPAPPGADQPYPNMASVPPTPTPPNQDQLKALTDSLIADRTNVRHEAEAAPLPDPSSPTASPGLFGAGTTPPPPPAVTTTQSPQTGPNTPAANQAAPPGAASASIPAVTAPPAPATPPSPAPRRPVQSAPLAAAAPPPTEAPTAPPTGGSVATATPAVQPQAPPAAGPQPTLPEAPPPRPAIAGAPPPPVPTPAPPMPAAGRDAAEIVFVAGSSQLLQPAADEVKSFATKRGNAIISVTGYGEATGGDPATQSAAVTLGLARAQAVVTALKADGVPANAIQVNAEASGRGAALRLLQ
jgi:outer membrane protein OmpA-like peptidoglycan-associated protein